MQLMLFACVAVAAAAPAPLAPLQKASKGKCVEGGRGSAAAGTFEKEKKKNVYVWNSNRYIMFL